MKKYLIVAVAIVILVASWTVLNKPESPSTSIKVGVAVAQTGIASEWGEGEYKLIKMLVEDFNKRGGANGTEVELIVEDTHSEDRGTVNAVTKLATLDKVPVILGPTWGDSFQGANLIAEKNKVVLLEQSAAFEAIEDMSKYTYLFSTWWPQLPEITRPLEYFVKHDLKKVAVVNEMDPFVFAMGNLFVSSIKKYPELTLVKHSVIPTGLKDFRTEILEIKKSNPDVVYLLLQDDTQMGPFIKQAKDLGLKGPFFSVTSAENARIVRDYASVVDGLLYTFPNLEKNALYEDITDRYKDYYGEDPTFPSFANTYNAVAALFEALNTGAKTGEEFKMALTKVSPKGLGVPEVKFDSNGQISGVTFEVRKIENGKFITIEK